MADGLPTRRSSRTSSAPSQASSEASGTSRSELRRRTVDARPAVVWGRPEGKTVAVADSVVASAPAVAIAPSTASSRRAARAARQAMGVEHDGADAPGIDPVLTPVEPFELIEPQPEPVDAELFAAESAPIELPTVTDDEQTDAAASVSDEFEAAARLFSFTGETPIQSAASDGADAGASRTDEGDTRPVSAEPSAHTTPRRSRSTFKRATAASFSVGVMGIVGLLTVGMTMPAEAVAAASGTVAPATAESVSVVTQAGEIEIADEEIQAYVAPATIENAPILRDEGYESITMSEFASEIGIKHTSDLFTNDPNSNIQWPFAVGVPMSSGFGWRWGRMHEGVDLVPGEGSPIQAIADGVVRIAENGGGAYGVQVVVDHIIDGKAVSSRYAHMISGSIAVTVGQKVKVGQKLGLTGNTGRSTGAHTHFEIRLGGTTAVDPIPWMREHTDGTHTVG